MVLIRRFLLHPHHFFFTAAEQCLHSEPNLGEKHFLLFINNLYGGFFCIFVTHVDNLVSVTNSDILKSL